MIQGADADALIEMQRESATMQNDIKQLAELAHKLEV
jgi:hypothetical protein